jgi:glycosyltransferase involved in cell wall biosynthesis
MKILFVTPGAEPDGASAQLTLLCQGLPRERFEAHVCTLGAGGPRAVPGAAGVPLTALGWARLLDPRPLWRLRRLVRSFRPDVIHAFRPASLRALALAVGRPPCPLVVSRPLTSRGRGGGVSRLDRWLLGRADRVVVEGAAEADGCLRAGLRADRLARIPPGVTLPPDGTASGSPGAGRTGTGHTVLCAGRFEPHKGYRDALWAYDPLRYVYPDLRLVLAGGGPDRPGLEKFVRQIGVEGQIHFPGVRADVFALMAAAEVVWVPSLADGGVLVALEAMAAGRPVVGSRLPRLAEAVIDGETGLLVPPGDKIALARATAKLLEDEGLRRRLGAAGRERVARHFSARAAVEGTAGLYAEVAA